jgi:hypothetical protein
MERRWERTRLRLPPELGAVQFQDAFARRPAQSVDAWLSIGPLLSAMPVTLLLSSRE